MPSILGLWDAVSLFFSGSLLADSFSVDVEGLSPSVLVVIASVGALLAPATGAGRARGWFEGGDISGVSARLGVCLGCVPCIQFWPWHGWPMLGWLLSWLVVALACVLAGRLLVSLLLRSIADRFGAERVYVLGEGGPAAWLRSALSEAGLPGIAVLSARDRSAGLEAALADLLEEARRTRIDRVIVAQPGLSPAQFGQIKRALRDMTVEVAASFPLWPEDRPNSCLGGIPLFAVAPRPQSGQGGLFKALFDRSLALLMLLWVFPLLVAIAVVIRLDSKGPALFRQRRHGVGGGEFEIFKFRTMTWQGAAASSGAAQTQRDDHRITRVGGFLRRTSFDEVPQLLNVLNGTMSLVGPRPHPVAMLTEQRSGEEITPEYRHRHRVKPGITGWAQINGLRGATDTAEKLCRRVEHDNFYIDHWSPWLDLRILAMTPVSLLFHRDNAF